MPIGAGLNLAAAIKNKVDVRVFAAQAMDQKEEQIS
jgi:hypothetical protein